MPAETVQHADAFYDPPPGYPTAPGALLRAESLPDRVVPSGSRAWRILYATRISGGAPATSAATVLAPANPTA